MEQKPGENDLRYYAHERTQAQSPPPAGDTGAGQPWQGGGWGPPQYTEVVEESGITGFRIIAKIIDYFVVNIVSSIVVMPIYLVWFFSNFDRFEELSTEAEAEAFPWDFYGTFLIVWAAMIGLMFLLSVAYYFILENKFQQTAGKKAFDLKVIDMTKGRASSGQLLARAVLYTFSLFLYFWIVELIVALVRSDGRSVTDLICGTTVIRVKKVYYYPSLQQRQ